MFCAGTPAALQLALDQAAANGQDDTVRLIAGTMFAEASINSNELRGITVSGGYNALCTQRVGTTTLDGASQRRPLSIVSDGDIAVERVRVVDGAGAGTGTGTGGMYLYSRVGDVRVEHCEFAYNEAGNGTPGHTGGLHAIAYDGQLTIRNNLFRGNSGETGALRLGQSNDVAFVTGNTVWGNACAGNGHAGGLRFDGFATFILSNNILWGNRADGCADIRAESPHVRASNDVGTVIGSSATPISSVGELDVDPGFALAPVPCSPQCSYSPMLRRDSPLVDAGVNNPAGGMSLVDLAGTPRTIGPTVDIGAYEIDRLLEDGFD